MFVSSIGVATKVVNAPQPKGQPSFKRQNYAKVFAEQFDAKLTSDISINNAFYYLNKACDFKGTVALDFFRKHFNPSLLWKNLTSFRCENYDASYDLFMKHADNNSVVLLKTDKFEPVVSVVNNGRYEQDNFISRLRRGGELRNVNIVFHDLEGKQDRVIIFGADYTGDGYLARGTLANPTERMETFYNGIGDEGPIKQRVLYSEASDSYSVENYNKDGSIAETSFLDDFKRTITGW